MKTRSRIKIIGIALALCVLLASLPVAAQSVSNLTYNGVVNSNMQLSWDNIVNTSEVKVQVTGGGIVDTWMSVDSLSVSAGASKTTASFTDMSSWQVSGTTYRFRVKVTLQSGSSTPWAYVDQS